MLTLDLTYNTYNILVCFLLKRCKLFRESSNLNLFSYEKVEQTNQSNMQVEPSVANEFNRTVHQTDDSGDAVAR